MRGRILGGVRSSQQGNACADTKNENFLRIDGRLLRCSLWRVARALRVDASSVGNSKRCCQVGDIMKHRSPRNKLGLPTLGNWLTSPLSIISHTAQSCRFCGRKWQNRVCLTILVTYTTDYRSKKGIGDMILTQIPI